MLSRRAFVSSLAAGGVSICGAARAGAPVDVVVSSGGFARAGAKSFRCAIGRGGFRADKHEGDGATPIGRWALREVFYRADRLARPRVALPMRAMRTDDGWCDAPGDPRYNRLVKHPYPASAEKLWRRDHVYDIVVVAGYNDAPVKPGAGSAIFLHVARSNYAPTAGCVAFAQADLLAILALVDARSALDVRG